MINRQQTYMANNIDREVGKVKKCINLINNLDECYATALLTGDTVVQQEGSGFSSCLWSSSVVFPCSTCVCLASL